MKLMSPWRNRTTSFERCFATSVKPSFSNTGSSVPGWGDANSTNSKPIRPIGFSNRSAMLNAPGMARPLSTDALEVAAEDRAALDVARRGVLEAGDVRVAQRTHQLRGSAEDERSV